MFDVKHPPLVDLRNVNTITVIPLEWDKTGRYGHLAERVTFALTQGVKLGKINFVDPDKLRFIPEQNYSQHVDVYITGRIINAGSYRNTETREELYNHATVTKLIETRTAFISIEYSYVRSVNREVLGTFKKSGTSRSVSEELIGPNTGRRGRFPNDPYQGHDQGQGNRQGQRPGQRQGQRHGYRQGNRHGQRGSQTDSLMTTAISKFSSTMSHEIAPWTTTEKRSIRRVSGNNPQVSEAGKLIRQKNYVEALNVYKDIYQKDGGVFAGYNTAVLLQANNEFTGALGLLKDLNSGITKSGKNSPAFIKKEIKRMEGYIKGFVILESYK